MPDAALDDGIWTDSEGRASAPEGGSEPHGGLRQSETVCEFETASSHFKHHFFCIYCERAGFNRTTREVLPLPPGAFAPHDSPVCASTP